MSSGSSRAIIANKMFELKTEVKQQLAQIAKNKNLSAEEKATYNAAVDLYESQRFNAAKIKLESLQHFK